MLPLSAYSTHLTSSSCKEEEIFGTEQKYYRSSVFWVVRKPIFQALEFCIFLTKISGAMDPSWYCSADKKENKKQEEIQRGWNQRQTAIQRQRETGRVRPRERQRLDDTYVWAVSSLPEPKPNTQFYELNCVPSPLNSYVEALTPTVIIIGNRAFKEVIEVK